MGRPRRPRIPVSWISPAITYPPYAIVRGDKGQPTRSATYGICPGKQTQHSSNLSFSNLNFVPLHRSYEKFLRSCFGRAYSG